MPQHRVRFEVRARDKIDVEALRNFVALPLDATTRNAIAAILSAHSRLAPLCGVPRAVQRLNFSKRPAG